MEKLFSVIFLIAGTSGKPIAHPTFFALAPIFKTARATILDKTVEKIAYLGAFFLNFVTDRFFPPLPLEAMLLGLLKKAGSLSISRKQL